MVFELTPAYIVLALLLIAPGFIAVYVAIIIGVVEREYSETRVFGFSLVSSLIIDTIFLAFYQFTGGSVQSLSSTKSVFFTPQFRADLVILLIAGSVVLGLLYAVSITKDVPGRIRAQIWSGSSHSRHPRQPWEGELEKAHQIMVITSDDEIVHGVLSEYSRVGKERQVVIEEPKWLVSSENSGTWESFDDESVLLFEDDIRRLSVLGRKTSNSANA